VSTGMEEHKVVSAPSWWWRRCEACRRTKQWCTAVQIICHDLARQPLIRAPLRRCRRRGKRAAPHATVRECVARRALNAEHGDDVACCRLRDVLQLVTVHSHQPRHLRRVCHGIVCGKQPYEYDWLQIPLATLSLQLGGLGYSLGITLGYDVTTRSGVCWQPSPANSNEKQIGVHGNELVCRLLPCIMVLQAVRPEQDLRLATGTRWSERGLALMRLPLAVLTRNSPLRRVPLYRRM